MIPRWLKASLETDGTFEMKSPHPRTKGQAKSHASKLIADELIYLRFQYEVALKEGSSIIANSIASDIADLVVAQQVIERLDVERENGQPVTACENCGAIPLAA